MVRRAICAAGLFLCRCGALWGDLRGGFLVAGVSGAGCLFRGVCGHLVASGGVFVVVSFICVDGLGVGFLVSCGGVVWRRGCRPACRVVVRGVCGVWCDFHVEDIAGCCCLVICNLSPPPRLEGVLGCFRRWVAFFAF